MRQYIEVSDILGMTFVKVVTDMDEDTIKFVRDDGRVYTMQHEQDCCENVFIESIIGELADLELKPITFAEESSNDDDTNPEWGMWTFYKFATLKGWVDIRWYGESNGYYGVGVNFFYDDGKDE